MMMGDYNAGSRTLFVSGSFAPENVVPVTLSGQAYTPLSRVDSNRGFPAAVSASEARPYLAWPSISCAGTGRPRPAIAHDRQCDRRPGRAISICQRAGYHIAGAQRGPAGRRSWVWDASASPDNYNPLPAPATPVYVISQPFDVAGTTDMTVDCVFDRDGSFTYPAAGSALASRIDHFGLIYYHANQAVQLATLLGVVLDTRPLPFYPYLDDVSGAYWRGPMPPAAMRHSAAYCYRWQHAGRGGLGERCEQRQPPDNREWHEFGHHFMADAFGNLLPIYGPRINHDGYKNTTTSDSWIEGFAEFFALLVDREIVKNGTTPHIYDLAGTASNLEANWISWGFRNTQSFQEFAVASLLWDLLDPANDKDATVLATQGVTARS